MPSKNTSSGSKFQSYKVKLNENAEKLLELISKDVEIPVNRLKLISGGKVLNPHGSLSEQNVKNFQQIMALEMKVDKEEAKAENHSYDRVLKIRNDAEALLKNKSNDYFKV